MSYETWPSDTAVEKIYGPVSYETWPSDTEVEKIYGPVDILQSTAAYI